MRLSGMWRFAFHSAMPSGFAHAPLSKGGPVLTVLIVATSLAALCVSVLDLKPYIRFQYTPHISTYAQYWQALAYHVAFTSSDRHVLCIVILYYAGTAIERRLGSRRYVVRRV